VTVVCKPDIEVLDHEYSSKIGPSIESQCLDHLYPKKKTVKKMNRKLTLKEQKLLLIKQSLVEYKGTVEIIYPVQLMYNFRYQSTRKNIKYCIPLSEISLI